MKEYSKLIWFIFNFKPILGWLFNINPIINGIYVLQPATYSVPAPLIFKQPTLTRQQLHLTELSETAAGSKPIDLQLFFVQPKPRQMLCFKLNETILLEYFYVWYDAWRPLSYSPLNQSYYDSPPIPHDVDILIRFHSFDKNRVSRNNVTLLEILSLKINESFHNLEPLAKIELPNDIVNHIDSMKFIFAFNDTQHSYFIVSRVGKKIKNQTIFLRVDKTGPNSISSLCEIATIDFANAQAISAAQHTNTLIKGKWKFVLFVAFSVKETDETRLEAFSMDDISADFLAAKTALDQGKGSTILSVIKAGLDFKECPENVKMCGPKGSQWPSGPMRAKKIWHSQGIIKPAAEVLIAWSMEWPPIYYFRTHRAFRAGANSEHIISGCSLSILGDPKLECFPDNLTEAAPGLRAPLSFEYFTVENMQILGEHPDSTRKLSFIECRIFKNCVDCSFHKKRKDMCGWFENSCQKLIENSTICLSITNLTTQPSEDFYSTEFTITLSESVNPHGQLRASVHFHNDEKGWLNISSVELQDSFILGSIDRADTGNYSIFVKIFYPNYQEFMSPVNITLEGYHVIPSYYDWWFGIKIILGLMVITAMIYFCYPFLVAIGKRSKDEKLIKEGGQQENKEKEAKEEEEEEEEVDQNGKKPEAEPGKEKKKKRKKIKSNLLGSKSNLSLRKDSDVTSLKKKIAKAEKDLKKGNYGATSNILSTMSAMESTVSTIKKDDKETSKTKSSTKILPATTESGKKVDSKMKIVATPEPKTKPGKEDKSVTKEDKKEDKSKTKDDKKDKKDDKKAEKKDASKDGKKDKKEDDKKDKKESKEKKEDDKKDKKEKKEDDKKDKKEDKTKSVKTVKDEKDVKGKAKATSKPKKS